MAKKRDIPPLHPGEILLEEFLVPIGISQYRLAKDISVPQRRISEIAQEKRAISADTALRLGRYFGMEPQFWLNLQTRYDLLYGRGIYGRESSEYHLCDDHDRGCAARRQVFQTTFSRRCGSRFLALQCRP